jgi:hypothetical protein
MNPILQRKQWSNTEEEQIIFFEDWTPDNLPAIANLRQNNKLANVHEFAIEPGMKAILNKLIMHKFSYSELNNILYQYWFSRAYTALQQYSNYVYPLIPNANINLLSEKGRRLLNELNRGANPPIEILRSACHKDEIDLDLFIDLHFDSADFADQEYKFLSPVSGCPYHCVYCAEQSGTKIQSMPYPVYLKILQSYATTDENKAAHIGPHNDSEAPMYFDKVLRADLGDVSHTASKWQSKISILTKGVPLGGMMDLALSKRYYSRNKPSISKVNISLLEGDDIGRNIDLAFNVQKIAMIYNAEHRLSAKIFASPENFIKYADQIRSIKGSKGTLFWAGLEPVGRAVNVKEAYIRLTDDEIAGVMERAGFKPGEVSTNMNVDFGHSRYLTADGHMQMDAFGRVYMKTSGGEGLTSDIFYDIYNINKTKVR